MSSLTESSEGDTPVKATPEEEVRYVGLATRVVSWVLDVLLINLVAIVTGLGVALIVAIFPLSKNAQPAFEAIAGAACVVWTAAYFVVFWSWTGQTPGARVLQVRLVTPSGGKVKPSRALVRWVGMNVAAVPLFWGYVPILFDGQRRGFADWLAHTRVIEARQASLAEARRATLRAARDSPGPRLPVD